MYCPEHLMYKSKSENLYVWFHDLADVRWEFIPWKRKYNPLRYEISVHRANGTCFVLNEDGVLARKFANAVYRIKKLLGMSK